MSRSMVIIEDLQTLYVGGYKIKLQANIRQYYEFNNCLTVRTAYNEAIDSNLIGYGYSDNNFLIRWKFKHQEVIGIIPENPDVKKIEEFISKQHYEDFIIQFSGKELLIVQAGDFSYRIDANTGEIYGRWESR